MQQRNLFRAMTTLGVALVSLWGAPAVRAQHATITPILPLADNVTTTALAVSADGNVVVGQSLDSSSNPTPFVWTVANGTVVFSGTSNSTSVTPTAVNDANGPVVTGSAVSSGKLEPFVYDATSGNFTALSPNITDQGARGLGVSDAGILAVNGFGSNVSTFTGYLYAPSNGTYVVTSLGLGGVFGISADGDYYPYLDSTAKAAGVFRLSTLGKSIGPTLAGNYSYSDVDAISPSGQYAVGVASNNATVGQTLKKGYVFDSFNGNATVLTPFNQNDVFAVCRTISNLRGNGPIGGGASGTSSIFSNEKAVLYDIALNATLDLKQLLKGLYKQDISPTNVAAGWTSLNEVHSISADGKTIIGDGMYAADNTTAGVRTGFVVTLTELPDEVTSGLAVVVNPQDTAVNIGTNATFVTVAIPGGNTTPITYQWFTVTSSGTTYTKIPNAVSGTLLIQNAQNSAEYACEVSDDPDTNVTANLTVKGALPTIDPIKKITVKVGREFELKAKADGMNGVDGQPSSYQWNFNGTAISGATGSTYTVKKAKSTSGGNYTVTIVSPVFGSITSAVKTVTVLYPPTITTQPVAVTVTAGQPAQLTVVASGSPPPTYQWYIHNRAITGRPSAKKPTLNFNVVHIPDGNLYRVRVMNSQGTVFSSYANLTVTPLKP